MLYQYGERENSFKNRILRKIYNYDASRAHVAFCPGCGAKFIIRVALELNKSHARIFN